MPPSVMDYQDDIRALWDSAVAAYEHETGRKLKANSTLRETCTIDGLLDLIEHQDSAFSGWRSRHGKLTSRLTLCLKPVTVFGQIAKDALANTPYGPASSAIFGAVIHLIRAAEGVSEAYDWIERALGQLQDLPDRLNLYRQNDIDAVLAKKISAILTCLLKVIGRCETLITRGRFRHYLQIVFLVKDEKTKKILEEMNESLDKEQRYVVAATYASQKTAEMGVKMLAQTTAETQKGVESAVHLLGGMLATWTFMRQADKSETLEIKRSRRRKDSLFSEAWSCQLLTGRLNFSRSSDPNSSRVLQIGSLRKLYSRHGRSRRYPSCGFSEAQAQGNPIWPPGRSNIYTRSTERTRPNLQGCLSHTSTSERMNSNYAMPIQF